VPLQKVYGSAQKPQAGQKILLQKPGAQQYFWRTLAFFVCFASLKRTIRRQCFSGKVQEQKPNLANTLQLLYIACIRLHYVLLCSHKKGKSK
jgi:hypothetical protein